MSKRIMMLALASTLLLAWSAAWADDAQPSVAERIAILQKDRDQLAAKIAADEKLLADQQDAAAKDALTKQLATEREHLAAMDKNLADLKGTPNAAAAAATPGAAPTAATDAAPPELTDEVKAQINDLKRTISGALSRVVARDAEIKTLPKDVVPTPGAPGGPGMPPGGPGMPPGAPVVQPGAPGMPPGAPGMPPGGYSPNSGGMPGTPGMPGGGWTRRDQLEYDQSQDLALIERCRAQLKILQEGPAKVYLFDENTPELHPLLLYTGTTLEKNAFGLSVGGWGSGEAKDTEYGVAKGGRSILVRTDDYYRGARFEFKTPAEVQTYFQQPKLSYLQFDIYFFPDASQKTAGGPGGYGSGSMPPGAPGSSPNSGSGPPPGYSPNSGGVPGAPGGYPGGMSGPPPGYSPNSGGVPGAPGGYPGGMSGPPPGYSPAPGGSPGSPGGYPGGMSGPPPGYTPPPGGGPGSPGGYPGGMTGPPVVPGAPGSYPGGSMPPGYTPPGGMPPGYTPPGGMPPGYTPPGGMPGAYPGSPGAGYPTGSGGMRKAPPATTMLRVELDTDRGPVIAEDQRFDPSFEVNTGWTRVFIPLTDFVNPSERTPTTLKRLLLFGDKSDAFYVGMVRFVTDGLPIKPVINGDKVMGAVAGQQFWLQGSATAGLSTVDYVWDWGDGTTPDKGKNPIGSHIYTKAGSFTVTLTCHDQDGLKEPGKATCTMQVKAFTDVPPVAPGAYPGAPGAYPPGYSPPGSSPGAPPGMPGAYPGYRPPAGGSQPPGTSPNLPTGRN